MNLIEYDTAIRAQGYEILCGVDEAGRGPLAGPVVAGAVVLPADHMIEGIQDSKKLSEKKRELLYDVITERAIAWGIGTATEKEIDSVNILQATYLAMRRAVEEMVYKLGEQPQLVIIDGNRDPLLGILTRLIVKGDATSSSIAAASILAKVTRDKMMLELDAQYPQYLFAKHKGYPTKEHYQKLQEFGASPVHRTSFLKKFYALTENDNEKTENINL